MELRELKSFVLLAEQLHYGRAARLLNLSQPALTKQIRRLEEELGSALFVRGTHGTSLSSFGRQFLLEAKPAVEGFARLLERAQRSAQGETGQLRLGFGYHTFELVPRLVVKLRQRAPGIEVSLRDMSTAEQIDGLRAGRIDLGFVRMPVDAEFRSLPVIRDRLSLISSHLPASATLADCRNEPFVALSEERSPGFFQHMLRLCARHGFHPRIIQQVPELTTALALVRAGLGVAVIPESLNPRQFPGIRFHPMKEKEASWAVGAAWRKADSNPALARFLELLREELKGKRTSNIEHRSGKT